MPDKIIRNLMINNSLKQQREKRSTREVIRVGFIVQVPEIWNKLQPVYEAMKADNSFDLELIVVPDNIKKSDSLSYENNYFIKKYPNAKKAYDEGRWLRISHQRYDYIFVQRPYDAYLPKGFRSYNLALCSKVCYIPYGFSGSNVFNDGNTNKEFFRSVYFAFLESPEMVDCMTRVFDSPRERKLHNFLYLGYPALQSMFSINNKRQYRSVLWTPRWSFDPIIGKSNFIKYKNEILKFAEEQTECNFTFRPHPLLFKELKNKELMSPNEMKKYLKQCQELNIRYDGNRPINEAFTDADILITDYSSIIIEFFITGKPIIYCDSAFELNSTYKKLLEGLYIVKTEEELRDRLKELSNGYDPLYDVRQKIIDEELTIHKNSVRAILTTILEDYNQ